MDSWYLYVDDGEKQVLHNFVLNENLEMDHESLKDSVRLIDFELSSPSDDDKIQREQTDFYRVYKETNSRINNADKDIVSADEANKVFDGHR